MAARATAVKPGAAAQTQAPPAAAAVASASLVAGRPIGAAWDFSAVPLTVADPDVPERRAVVQRKCACGRPAPPDGECDACRAGRLQKKGARGPATAPASVADVLRGPGEALDPGICGLMSARFGHDFREVRIHRDASAAASAQDVQAQAYTVGRHVVFGAGHFAPATAAGRQLLAHELTHVVQQRRAPAADRPDPTAAAQAEAEALSNERRLHTATPLTTSGRPAALARRTEVTAPAGPPGCTPDQHDKIYPAANLAIAWLDRTLEALRRFIAAPGEPAHAATADTLQRFFRSREPVVARRVFERLEIVRHDFDTRRDPPQIRTECHDAQDTGCGDANAYVRGDRLVLCPAFFTFGLDQRAESLVHEMAHAIVSGGARSDIVDRSYRSERLLLGLTGEEALTNAESYGLLVQSIGSGTPPATPAVRDDVDRACRDIEPLVRTAIARGEVWNRIGATHLDKASPAMLRRHLGGDTPALRNAAQAFFARARESLRKPLDVRCAPQCGAGVVAYGETSANWTPLGSALGLLAGVGLGLLVGGGLGLLFGALGIGVSVGTAMTIGGVLGGIGGLITGSSLGNRRSHGPRVHVCPGWKDLPDEPARVEAILRAAYEALGNGDADSRKYAALAAALQAQAFPVPTMDQIDQDFVETRLRLVRQRLGMLRAEYQRGSDAFAGSVADERQRQSVAQGQRDVRRQTRSDAGDRELWGGRFAGDRIRRVARATTNGMVATLAVPVEVTYQALSAADAGRQATTDLPRIADTIRSVWQVDVTQGEYAGVRFQLLPTVTHLPAGRPRSEGAFLIEVRGPDTGPSSGDSVSGTISLAPVHLQGARVIVVAHELAHLFGFTDAYLSEFRRDAQGRTQERMSVARSDPANRPDLLGMIDPEVLARKQRVGAVTAQDVARQTRPVRVWEEEAVIVLRTLGVAPPRPAPNPDSAGFDPQVELDRVRQGGDARLADIQRRRDRIDNTMRSLSLAEEILRLEAEERDLAARLAAPRPAAPPPAPPVAPAPPPARP